MISIAIVGASGYTGAEMCQLVEQHPQLKVSGLYVSENSEDKGRDINALYPQFSGRFSHQLQPLTNEAMAAIKENNDAVVLATSHEVSHALAAEFYQAGLSVFDLSGAYRFKEGSYIDEYYGFNHQHPELLSEAVYGLAEWNAQAIRTSKLIAVPGCYPTASLLALKPLFENNLLDSNQWPVINAVSGVTGAGRKASMVNSFCEVSLTPYGVLGHRHQPEITTQLGCPVIFTPHLGNFKRGILATITVKLNDKVTAEQLAAAYGVYEDKPLVRVRDDSWPKIDQVAGTPFCDIAWKYDAQSGHLVVASAIDNLLKGAAGQGLQCILIHFGLTEVA
ncbi:N-acetyl-gamma-glutamyl-phosphate reductase [Alteromonadales bacterium alter-6D02]|nr:N-acetyl-gamma-glutamyl-phosphate reductase [Alteromonadales bacterium alter-6D02]